MLMQILETERLIVRYLKSDDLDDLYAITGNAELMRYVGDNNPISREQTQQWIDVSIENYRSKGFGSCAIIDKASGDFCGYCGIIYAPGCEDPEIIYAFKKAYWGKGYATEVAHAMLDYGFRQLKLPRIIATIDPDNTPSITIVQKLGMHYLRFELDEHGLPTHVYALDNPLIKD
jgi:RimJ/RimL family protein N-acetyltransferase